ncbi:hypothetical protein FUA48_12175 [Flavobacterium alkalisoli]|uniref:Uncharacterized protein n=1 Tax=Flavobacterium alkalisoli TaxID=2602769 RepID=A0A5B9FTH5_9FLAO|nr:hypothetical protein [Flavobacterium alkalisoli]QEE50305.1 hypothetical protein FUA48_12175 [Flavobacterium alkalisoli]
MYNKIPRTGDFNLELIMIRVYLDWAIYSRLESNTENYKKLTNILKNDSKYILPYSHAHILDIYKSYLKEGEDGISGHLNKIQKYSKSLFITNRNDKIEFLNLEAKEAMNQYLDANKNIDSIDFENILESLKGILPIMNLQLPNPWSIENDKTFYEDSLKKYPNTLEQSKKLLGNDQTISMTDFFRNLFNLSKTILSDNSYIDARTAYQKDLKVNTGRLNDKRFDSLEVLNEFAVKNGQESFLHYFDKFIGNEKNINFFTKIIKLCSFLDFQGVGVETVKIGHHLDNIISDYNHVAFASTCDIFVIDDKKTREKAKIAFELFNINIKIFNVSDFITYIENN